MANIHTLDVLKTAALNSDTLSSGHLLYETFLKGHAPKRYYHLITKLQNALGTNKVIWGCKTKHNRSDVRWELYLYLHSLSISNQDVFRFLDICGASISTVLHVKEKYEDLTVISYDLDPTVFTSNFHFYYRRSDKQQHTKLPYVGYGRCDSTNSLESYFLVDEAYSFLFHNDYYAGFEKSEFSSFPFEKYGNTNQLCIFNKWPQNERQPLLMYLGINDEHFHSFVKREFSWTFCNQYNGLCHEIAEVIDMRTKKVLRSGFYGVV